LGGRARAAARLRGGSCVTILRSFAPPSGTGATSTSRLAPSASGLSGRSALDHRTRPRPRLPGAGSCAGALAKGVLFASLKEAWSRCAVDSDESEAQQRTDLEAGADVHQSSLDLFRFGRLPGRAAVSRRRPYKVARPFPLDDFATWRRKSSSLFHGRVFMMRNSGSFQRLGEDSPERRSLEKVVAKIV
jgi:hypothetical protein